MTIRGQITVNARGFGFVEWEEDGRRRSAFVPPPRLRPLLDLDQVEAEIEEDEKGYTVRKVVLEERRRTQLFGAVIQRRDGRLALRPDPEVANSAWPIHESDISDLAAGMRVVADIRGKGVRARRLVKD